MCNTDGKYPKWKYNCLLNKLKFNKIFVQKKNFIEFQFNKQLYFHFEYLPRILLKSSSIRN